MERRQTGPNGSPDRISLWMGMLIMAFEALLLVLWAYAPLTSEKMVPQYGMLAAVAFAGMTMACVRRRVPLVYWVGYLYVIWYVASRVLLGDLYLKNSVLYVARTVVSYCVALPFAFVMRDGRRQRGMDCLAVLYAVPITVLAAAGVTAALMNLHMYLPVFSTEIYTDGRLFAGQHANGCAMMFLMAIAFALYLMLRIRRGWAYGIGALMIAVNYLGIAFTVSRTVMVECSLIAAALGFCGMLRVKRLSRPLRTAAALALAMACMLACYAGLNACVRLQFSLEASAQEAESLAEAEQVQEEPSAENESAPALSRPLLKDLGTLTGRTDIYRAVIAYIRMHPDVLLTGMLERDIVTNLKREVMPDFWLAHNGWLQTVLTVGLPGLLAALYLTWLAVKYAVQALLLRAGRTTLAQKMAALLPLLLVINCVTECVLFVEQFSIGNFAFLMCLGYTGEMLRQDA